jgi:PAS domain S-box-containing protein
MIVVSVLILETFLVIFAGEGSRDISILIYPASIVIAGLLLSKRSFIIITVVIIISFAFIMIAEIQGVIKPRQNLVINTRDLVDMIIILMVTAIIVSFLTENLRQSIARNSALLSALPDLVFRLNRDGTFLDFSAPRNQTLFASPQEFLGKRITAIFPESIGVQTVAAVNAALDQKTVQQFEYELWINNRREYWEARIATLQEDEVVAVVRNITNQKLAEEQRRLSEEKFSQVFMTNPDSLTLMRLKDDIYIDVNDGFTRLYGYTREEMVGHRAEEIEIWKNAEDRQQIPALLQNQNSLENKETDFIKKDGTYFTGLLSASRIQVAGETCIISDVRDITEQRKLQTELMQSQKIQSIGTLAGGVAHDFNNILGIIFGYAGLLEKNRLNAVLHKEGLQAIVKAAERGAELVGQILTFARKTEVTFLPLDVPLVIRELLSMLKQTFPKTITFGEHYADDLPDIMGDKIQIDQALLNLFVNSRDAMPHGGCITIDVNLMLLNKLRRRFPSAYHPFYVCVHITDTGCGMDEATRQRIFDPFFTTKEYGHGTGLGLSVVYGIIQAHQGYIDVESTVGKGTTFSLYFPATNIIGWKHQDEQQLPEEQSHGTETILVVEDEELLLAMVRLRLEAQGYSVIEASDGEKALEVFAQHHTEIALVLSDLGLPKMSGIDVFIKMKEIDPDVRVIVASGYFDPQNKSELEQLGAKGFVMKPYKTDQLLQKIRDVLNTK